MDTQDRPLGFLCGQDCGAYWHIVELSVQQSAQGQGLGRRLISEAAVWAREQGYAGLSLTTFASVPWNAPFYARLGFKQLDPPPLNEFLQHQLATEAADGLPDRCAMRLDFKVLD
ncbi:Acetyltransferase (GNAT) family protein [compost metagenome]